MSARGHEVSQKPVHVIEDQVDTVRQRVQARLDGGIIADPHHRGARKTGRQRRQRGELRGIRRVQDEDARGQIRRQGAGDAHRRHANVEVESQLHGNQRDRVVADQQHTGRRSGGPKAPQNRRAKLTALPGLGNVVDGPELHALDDGLALADGAHHDHGRSNPGRVEPPQKLFAGHLGHPEIEEHDVDGLVGQEIQRLRTAPGGHDVEIVLEFDPDEVEDGLLVVDRKDRPSRRLGHAVSFSSRRREVRRRKDSSPSREGNRP